MGLQNLQLNQNNLVDGSPHIKLEGLESSHCTAYWEANLSKLNNTREDKEN